MAAQGAPGFFAKNGLGRSAGGGQGTAIGVRSWRCDKRTAPSRGFTVDPRSRYGPSPALLPQNWCPEGQFPLIRHAGCTLDPTRQQRARAKQVLFGQVVSRLRLTTMPFEATVVVGQASAPTGRTRHRARRGLMNGGVIGKAQVRARSRKIRGNGEGRRATNRCVRRSSLASSKNEAAVEVLPP